MTAPTTMYEVQRRNEDAGLFFFEAGAMSFFNSEIESGLYVGAGCAFFVTSEAMNADDPRDYTVRVARQDGHVQTVGEFREFDTLADACQAARACRTARAEVSFDPHEYDREQGVGPDAVDRFVWRCLLVPAEGSGFGRPLAVDVRTTKAKAEQLAAELNNETGGDGA